MTWLRVERNQLAEAARSAGKMAEAQAVGLWGHGPRWALLWEALAVQALRSARDPGAWFTAAVRAHSAGSAGRRFQPTQDDEASAQLRLGWKTGRPRPNPRTARRVGPDGKSGTCSIGTLLASGRAAGR